MPKFRMLTKEAIEEFRKIYRAVHGVEISFEQASEMANALIKLYRAVCSE
jgi:phosphoenolpyruvate synthase/pyruvate phosphate dikinase